MKAAFSRVLYFLSLLVITVMVSPSPLAAVDSSDDLFAMSHSVIGDNGSISDSNFFLTTTPQSLIDDETAENIADALWLNRFNFRQINPKIRAKILSKKNSSEVIGGHYSNHLSSLLTEPDSFTPDYTILYTTLQEYLKSPSIHQLYALNSLLGLDSNRGYQALPAAKSFEWPKDDRMQMEYQVDWHFFVGSVFAETGEEFGVQLMFWSQSMLPPTVAKAAGLSDVENQVTEMHFAITPVGERHYRAKPTIVAGTTGLIKYAEEPIRFNMGKNLMHASKPESFFPLRLRAHGVDRTETLAVPIEMDIKVTQVKGYILNGEDGMAPSCDGVGTLYYSVPSLMIDPDHSTIKVRNKTYRLARGKIWYDHQWGTGFIPAGNVASPFMRALRNISPSKSAPGWDWMFAAFDDDTEIALSSLHMADLAEFYMNTGANPPGVMTASASGRYIDATSESFPVTATIRVTEWVKSTVSHGQYQPTGAWYPNRVEVSVDTLEVPQSKRNFTLIPIVKTGQQGYFAAGPQYSEGAVYVEQNNQPVGRGFLESTGYADPLKQTLLLAGISDTPSFRLALESAKPNDALKLDSFNYVNANKNSVTVTPDPTKSDQPGYIVCRGTQ